MTGFLLGWLFISILVAAAWDTVSKWLKRRRQ
jgi:hypothetical protein